jgi:hypothetical protein
VAGDYKIKIKHKGIEIAKAKRNGVSTHTQLERDSKSSNPTVKKRGVLGLTFERGFSPK